MPGAEQALNSVACVKCGSSLPLDPERAEVTCRYCAATFTVPEPVRARARAHAQKTAAAWRREIEARYLELLHAAAARSNPGTMRWMVPLLMALPFWMIALGTGYAARFHPLITLGCIAITIAAAARVFGGITGPSRPFAISLIVASGLGACEECGGPVKVPEGTTAAKCGYCGATGQVSESQRRAMLETALRRVAPAQADSFEAIQRNFRSLEGAGSVFGVFGKADLATIMLVVTVGAMILVAVLAVTVYRDAPSAHATGWVVPALVLGLVVVAVHNVMKVKRLLRARVELDAILRGRTEARGGPRHG